MVERGIAHLDRDGGAVGAKAPYCAPAAGLTLVKVCYPGDFAAPPREPRSTEGA